MSLASKFPQVKFIAVGRLLDKQWDSYLRTTYSNLANLEMTGFIDHFSSDQLSQVLKRSWIMVNTSATEGLPNSFIEAAAHKCVILRAVDPDGFASQFGDHVKDDDFSKGLAFVLKNERWNERGEYGSQYIKETSEINRTIDQHIVIYCYL